MRAYLGIDPGLKGGVALITEEGFHGVWDTPAVKVQRGNDYLVASMRDLFDGFEMYEVVAAVERGIPMPKQSSSSTFKNGRGIGLWEGLLVGRGVPYELVTPQRWKHALGIAKRAPKSASRVLAQQLFPEATDRLQRVKDDGRAEAMLIAEWRRRQG